MFSFVDLRLLLLVAATALLTHGQEEGQEEDSKSQTLRECRATWYLALRSVPGVHDLLNLGMLRRLRDGREMVRAFLGRRDREGSAPWGGGWR